MWSPLALPGWLAGAEIRAVVRGRGGVIGARRPRPPQTHARRGRLGPDVVSVFSVSVPRRYVARRLRGAGCVWWSRPDRARHAPGPRCLFLRYALPLFLGTNRTMERTSTDYSLSGAAPSGHPIPISFPAPALRAGGRGGRPRPPIPWGPIGGIPLYVCRRCILLLASQQD